ncbi:hypothetical protein [Anaplasma marginale]|nr:hypothetical protein [Anaplasma marginale]
MAPRMLDSLDWRLYNKTTACAAAIAGSCCVVAVAASFVGVLCLVMSK